MGSIWGTFWLLQHAMLARPGCNLAHLCVRSGPIQGDKVIACRSTTNGFICKRMRLYRKLETVYMRCIIIRRSLWILFRKKSAIFQTYRIWNCLLGSPLSKFVCSPQISQSVEKVIGHGIPPL